MLYVIYMLAGLAGGNLTGMAGLTAAMVLTPIHCGACGWSGYDATTLALIANVPSAMVTSWTFYKNGNLDIRRSVPFLRGCENDSVEFGKFAINFAKRFAISVYPCYTICAL